MPPRYKQGADVLNNFLSSVAMQSTLFQYSYAALKIVYDIDSRPRAALIPSLGTIGNFASVHASVVRVFVRVNTGLPCSLRTV